MRKSYLAEEQGYSTNLLINFIQNVLQAQTN